MNIKINGKEITNEQDELLSVAYDLDEAEEMLENCIEILERVNQQFEDRNAEAYLIDQLKTRVNDEHGFLSSNLTIGGWREKLIRRITEDQFEGGDN